MHALPHLLVDFYKFGHPQQYPADVTQVYSNWTPRSSRVDAPDGVIHFGTQHFIKTRLAQWSQFFATPKASIVSDYRKLISATLGVSDPLTRHLEELHDLQYLPLDIWAIPEGFSVPLGVPMLVITNTHRAGYFLPNYLETILSATLWKACTSATTARRYRQIFTRWAVKFGETDLSFVDWMGHDFSFRGMSGLEDAVMSGMGHLLSFNGSDTVPAILAAHEYYGAPLSCGGSVPATEHSVMCAGEKEGEFETIKRLVTEIYPSGIVSIVSDTWDLWKVLTDYLPRLKETILARDGKVVIRPDSGKPEDILCGIPYAQRLPGMDGPEARGVLEILRRTFGTDGKGHINKVGAIYGDSITPARAEEIMRRTVTDLGLSPFNIVLGIGSFTYEFTTRDQYGFAEKATAVVRGGKLIDIYKDPVTDAAKEKKSLKGIPAVYRTPTSTEERPYYFVADGCLPGDLDNCAFQKVYSNGKLLIDQDFETIRKRVRQW